jgi:iron complex outermembrane recepter protein
MQRTVLARFMLLVTGAIAANARFDVAIAQESPETGAATAGSQLEEVVVTAQKRSEDLRNVPISISVLNGATLEERHVESIDDLTRLAPGVSFAAGGGEGAGEGQQTIEIRGVSSNVGAATVGMYLDETPITLPGEVGTSLPKMFDMDRVEVLRGPQGTLYGSSSEGGTVRFITNKANTSQFEADTSADVSYTRHGDANYEVRGLTNIPLIQDQLGLRFGVLYADNSGWIDRYGHPPGDITTSDGQLIKSNVNDEYDFAAKLTATYTPSSDLTITPFFYFQRVKSEDQPSFFLGQPLYTQENNVAQPVRDSFFVSDVTINKELGFADLTSVSSWYWKEIYRQADGTYYDPEYVVPFIMDPAYPAQQPVADATLADLPTTAYDRQTVTTLTQELRLASRKLSEGDLPLTWVAGLYFSYNTYRLKHEEVAPGWNSLFTQIYGFSPDNAALSPVADPADPTLWAGDKFQWNYTLRKTKTYAGFGQLGYDPWTILHLSAGLRYDFNQLPYARYAGGFFNVGNPTAYQSYETEHAVTPKFSITVDATDSTNVYASAAKGFRVGGPNNPVPQAICQVDYDTLGIAAEPTKYAHDELWTYELGSKSALLDRSLSLSGDVYYTSWKDIQQQIELPTCGYAYVSNVGDAAIKGAELELRDKVQPLGGVTLGLTASYQNAQITSALPGSPASVGQHVLYTPEWNAVFSADRSWSIASHSRVIFHLDYDWTGPSNGSYVPSSPDYKDPSYGVLNANLGLAFGQSQLTLYANNALDNSTIIKHPEVNLVIEAYTVVPRIIGIKYARHFD